MFNRPLRLYSIVGEIKSSVEAGGDNQNIEQMVGLWRRGQKAMLGFTCYPEGVKLRVMVEAEEEVDTLRVLNLRPLALKSCSSLERLAEYFIAYVDLYF